MEKLKSVYKFCEFKIVSILGIVNGAKNLCIKFRKNERKIVKYADAEILNLYV